MLLLALTVGRSVGRSFGRADTGARTHFVRGGFPVLFHLCVSTRQRCVRFPIDAAELLRDLMMLFLG